MKRILTIFLIISLAFTDAAAEISPQSSDLRSDIQRLEDSLKQNPGNMEAMVMLCVRNMTLKRFDEATRYARMMLSATEGHKALKEDRITAFAYAGQAYIASDKYDSSYMYLKQGLDYIKDSLEASEVKNLGLPMYILYNCLGIYYINKEMDYDKAADCFIKGLEAADKYSEGTEYAVIAHNLVVSFFTTENPSGLKYALKVYNDGIRRNDELLKFMGAYGSAMMYSLKKEWKEAERYIKEALECEKAYYDRMGTNNLYAIILHETGRPADAEKHFRTALQYLDIESATTAIFVCLSYGNFLVSQGRDTEAIGILQKGIDISAEKNNIIFTSKLYHSMSEAYSAIGNTDKSYECYRKYSQAKDSIFTIRKERAMNELSLKYETAKQEAVLNEYKLQIEKKNREIQASIFITVIILIIMSVIYILYRNKNKMYMTIVRQYKEAIAKASPSLTREKTDTIFEKMDRLMKESELFRDPTITREKVAEMTGTNRTYLSKAISERTGKSFNQYVSSLRISYALQKLSDTGNDAPLKSIAAEAGFCSQSNFFKQFKDEVGMTPSKYREKIMELSKEEKRPSDSDETEE